MLYYENRGISSNGRAIALHAIGSGIDTRILHFFHACIKMFLSQLVIHPSGRLIDFLSIQQRLVLLNAFKAPIGCFMEKEKEYPGLRERPLYFLQPKCLHHFTKSMTRRGGRRGSSSGNAPQYQNINSQQNESGGSLSVCKYFLSGHCKYGNTCRFQHIGNPQAPTGANPPKHQQQQQKHGHGTLPAQVRMEEVVLFDLGINIPWPFSCYGIVEDWDLGGNMIVGDFSQEELRMEAYAQQRALGNIHNYQQQVAHLKAVVDARRAAISANPKLAIEEACSRKPLLSQNIYQQAMAPQNIHPQVITPPNIPQNLQIHQNTAQPPISQPPLAIPQPSIHMIPQQQQPQQQTQSSTLHPQAYSYVESPQVFEFGKIPEVLPTKKA